MSRGTRFTTSKCIL
jgi:hypothetical protein